MFAVNKHKHWFPNIKGISTVELRCKELDEFPMGFVRNKISLRYSTMKRC